MFHLLLTSSAPAETTRFAQALAGMLAGGDCLLLAGDLGAGKTWFVSGLLTALGVREQVHSPTFNLVNVYQTAAGVPVYHADFYRLDSLDELLAIGWEDYLDGQGLLLVEWGDRFPEALPADHLRVTFATVGGQQRELAVSAHGQRSQQIEKGWADALVSR